MSKFDTLLNEYWNKYTKSDNKKLNLLDELKKLGFEETDKDIYTLEKKGNKYIASGLTNSQMKVSTDLLHIKDKWFSPKDVVSIITYIKTLLK
ncbi:hypothetical protein KY334_05470 [Candidatus Woesearchaeota archaeon]|nr:hypothetical protein [Candidatus Woesearchaeota archaeon]